MKARQIHNSPTNEIIHEGDRVLLDVEKIQSHPDYSRLRQSYKDFVDNSSGKVFTVHVVRKRLIILKECPQWLFWKGDLIKVTEEGAQNDSM